jgi:hypothetical protein
MLEQQAQQGDAALAEQRRLAPVKEHTDAEVERKPAKPANFRHDLPPACSAKFCKKFGWNS